MNANEILFSYNNTRCHAVIVSPLLIESNADLSNAIKNPNRYIGEIDGYDIYSFSAMFHQFGFFAIKKGAKI